MQIHVLNRWAQRSAVGLMALAVLFGLGQATSGCLRYPDADERFDDEIIYTHYDKKADFQDFATFAISPEVVVISEDDGEIEREPLNENYAEDLVEQVVDNLTDRGYRQVTREENPDLAVTITVLSGTVSTYYAGYWGAYWGYPYYYYYYPYSYYEYSYNTGTVVVDAIDLKNAPAPLPSGDGGVALGDGGVPAGGAGHLTAVWTGLVYGVMSGINSEDVQDAVHGIDQAFKQSPYFRANEGSD